MKKWDDITEECLKNMPMNFVVRTCVDNEHWSQAIRRVIGGWIYYEKCTDNQKIGTFVPEERDKE